MEKRICETDGTVYKRCRLSTFLPLKIVFIAFLQAKVKLMSTKMGQQMDNDKRADYLKPFTLNTILREQMLNLVEENEGVNIILKQSSKSIKKDNSFFISPPTS